MQHSSRTNQSGITLVEIVIVISMLSILIFLIFTVLFDFLKSNYSIMGSTVQANDTRSALHMIESDLNTSVSFASEPSLPDPTSTNWKWTGTSADSRVLVVNSYATDKPKSDSSRALIFSRASSCSTGLLNNNVYFVSDGTLYRRTITAVEAGGRCGAEPAQKQTCTPAQKDGGNTACQATDAVITRNVTSFKVDYFAQPTDTTPISNAYSESPVYNIGGVKTIVVSLTTKSTSMGSTNENSGTIRISLE